ncbi:MAG: hypothetical protein ACRDP1_06535 [Nocardioidaceae bacterium]
MNRLMKRVALPIGAAIMLGTTGFAFMASNSVAPSNAGVGSGAISGYNVRNVHYAIVDNPNTPGGTYIQQVSFTLSPDNATQARAWFEDTSGQWVSGIYQCAETTGTWTCQNPNVINGHQWSATQDAFQLHVSAAQ